MVAATLSLPLAAPLVQSYLFHAYPLAILAGHGTASLPWILSSFIQLYHRPGGELKFYVHPWSPADHLRQTVLFHCPWLDVQHLDQRLLSGRLLPFLQQCIEEGFYPQIDIDYGCLPWSRQHEWLHELLLCGVDRQAGEFEALAYDSDGVFHTLRVDAQTLEAGAAAALHLARAASLRDERPRLLLYRFIEHGPYRFDVESLCDQLWDYLEAADSSIRCRAIAPAIEAVWGTGTLAWLEACLLAVDAEEFPQDHLQIPLRVWWEHKRLMAMRCAYLEQEGYLDPAQRASVNARDIARSAWQARLCALRWRSGSAVETGPVLALLRDSAARELDVIGGVVHTLSSSTHQRSVA